MIDDKKIKKILNDLYKIDPEFKSHEKKLVKIIKELLLLQPDIKPDSKFAEDLKLMLKTEEKKINKVKANKKEETSKNYFTSFSFLFDLSRSFVIVSVLLLLVVSFSFVRLQKDASKFVHQNKPENSFLNIEQETRIVKKGKNSFGNLYSQLTAGTESSMLSSRADDRVLGMGDGNMTTMEAEEGKIASSDMSIMPMPVKYNYIYTGDEFEMFESEEEVYKRVPLDISKQFANNFSSSGLLINTNKFSNAGVSSFSLMEDRDFGYNISFYFEDGSVSLYKNWKKWPRIEELCGGWENYECIESHRLSFDQILSNEETLSIADNFLNEYGVDLSSYGPGEVQNDWLRDYAATEDKSNYYIPESISVVYPLIIDDKMVYEEYGNKSGIVVEVDMREKKASGLYSMFYQNYESSVYETEGDREKIMELVYNGGAYPYYDYFVEGEYETVDIELGAPSLELVKIWNYDETKMTNQELYVPAYVFPIISQSKPNYFYRKNIVIPAVKDFFNRYNYPGQPRILPIDLSEPMEADGSVSSGGSDGLAETLIIE
ncbi:MAG: hypothetical protein WC164_02040 [Patescibacteria group bacterium]|nr:hypothetical protein [Patescibacteria group bacterium]